MADYLVTDTELTSVADAIRTKGGTSASMVWPTGFVSAISDISGGGSTDTADFIIEGQAGSYYNSTASKVRKYGFLNFDGLTGVEMTSCMDIGSYGFSGCSSLTTASFPVCETIGPSAFYSCSALETVSFPACTNMSSNAFGRCSALTAVSFPFCTNIGSYAFTNCAVLTTATFPVCETIGASAFYSCSALTTVSFPVCTTIASSAFAFCRMLETASFPACSIINYFAFSGCSKLTSLYLLGSSVCTLSNVGAFNGTPMSNSTYTGIFGSIYVPSSLYDSYVAATNWSAYSERFVSM